jgi:multiple sugar transport system substrate-binding protein
MRKTLTTITGALLAGLLTLTACSAGDDKPGSGASAAPGGKITLSFWDWDPNMDKVVAIWNSSHPDIQVRLSNPAGGDQLVAKMITAHQARNGPEIAKVEYQSLPALVSNGVVSDITAHVGDAIKDFDDATLAATRFEGKVYGIPQDTAPLMLFYRKDLFDKYGLKVPSTWDEYAQAAAQLRQKNPKAWLTNFDAADPGWFTGLTQQAGADWWKSDGKAWQVAINGPESRKVADYWQDLVKKNLVLKNPSFSPQWNRQMNDGSILTWVCGAWAPAQLGGIAPSTKGKWAVAPIPAWTAGDKTTGIWGGSAITVTSDAKHPAEAAKFAAWLNTDPQAVTAQVQNINVYPAATSGRALPILAKAPAFFPNQPDFYSIVKDVAPAARSYAIWGPNVTVTFKSYSDSFGKALQTGGSFGDALSTMQQATVADMTKLGFAVS